MPCRAADEQASEASGAAAQTAQAADEAAAEAAGNPAEAAGGDETQDAADETSQDTADETPQDAAQTDVGGASVRYLDAYGAGAGDRSFDADFVDSEIKRELFVASKDFAKVDAGGRLHGILSDARADVGTLHLDLDTKLGEGGFNHKGILLNITGIGGGGFLLEEVGGRRLPIGVVHGD